MNILDFTYDGVHRSGFGYDANGNVTNDPLRGFEMSYNLLNLASQVRWRASGTPSTDPTLLAEAMYYADGTRAGVMDPESGYWTARYIGSLIYYGESGEESLDGIQTGDGYIDCRGGGVGDAEMQYFLRDHLGSVRVVASDRNTVLRRSDYLPFGVRMEMDDLQQGVGRSGFFGFSGKENEMWPSPYGSTGVVSSPVQSISHWELGERYQHFGARAYDPLTCTFLQTDPLAEKYYGVCPYAYCGNNPVMFVDPDGRCLDLIWDAANVAMDAKSFVSNVKQGNVGAAILDGVGLTIDVAAAVIPFVPGGAGTALKAARGVDKAVDIARSSDNVVDASKVASDYCAKTSREARRESMRQAGIPTSQQPISQSKNASGREYRYESKGAYGTTVEKSVQQQTLDRSHSGEKHWEAGTTKKNGQYNHYGWPRLDNNKTKVNY